MPWPARHRLSWPARTAWTAATGTAAPGSVATRPALAVPARSTSSATAGWPSRPPHRATSAGKHPSVAGCGRPALLADGCGEGIDLLQVGLEGEVAVVQHDVVENTVVREVE